MWRSTSFGSMGRAEEQGRGQTAALGGQAVNLPGQCSWGCVTLTSAGVWDGGSSLNEGQKQSREEKEKCKHSSQKRGGGGVNI